MANDWRERLKEKAKTAEQKEAERAVEEQKHKADAARAVGQGLSAVRRLFEEVQLMLAPKYSARMEVGYNSMNESTFRFDQHVISAKRSADGLSLVIDKDGEQTILTWHPSSYELLPQGPGGGLPMTFSLGRFVGELVESVISE